jgi:hypothetical protein
MLPSHVSILKANRAELDALANLDSRTAPKTMPLFEVGRLTDAIRERKYIQRSRTPTMTHLNRILDAVGNVWSSRSAMVDGYHWSADACAENGEHVIAHMVAGLRERGVSVIPVVGYDRWGNPMYRFGLKAIPARDDGHFCLRLDSSAVEDAAEPEHFRETITDIVEELVLDPSRCSVLLDFADISSGAMSIEMLVQKSDSIIRQLEEEFGFGHYIIAGCSIPRSIDLAVSSRDSSGMVLRKEMLTWQALRLSIPDLPLVSGDYGVRGPTTTEVATKYINGKIRYTTKKQTYVVRGHAFIDDHSNAQMSGLAKTVVRSPHYLGENFSWGDGQIKFCSDHGAFGNPGTWIAIDTNHHLVFVVQEVEEFERDRVAKVRVES